MSPSLRPPSQSEPMPADPASWWEGLKLTVPALPPVSKKQLLDSFQALVRSHATRRALAVGEPLGLHDEAQLDMLGFAAGRLVPGAALTGALVRLEPGALVEGFTEALLGTRVGEQKDLQVKLPATFEVEALRGAQATFRVTVKAGWEVHEPNPESAEFLRKLGLGRTLEETLTALVPHVQEEHQALHRLKVREQVLTALGERQQGSLPEAAVLEVLTREWEEGEGAALAKHQVPEAWGGEARAAWLEDPARRARAERQVRAYLAVRAVAEQEALRLTEAARHEALEEAARWRGQSPEELRAECARDARVAEELEHVAWCNLVVERVLKRAQARTV